MVTKEICVSSLSEFTSASLFTNLSVPIFLSLKMRIVAPTS